MELHVCPQVFPLFFFSIFFYLSLSHIHFYKFRPLNLHAAQPHSPSLPPTLHTHATTRIRPRHPSSASTARIRPRLSSTCIGDRAPRIIAPLHHCTVFVRSSARSRRAAAAAAGDLLDHPRDVRHARPALRLRDGAPHPDPQQPHGGGAGAGGDDGVDDLLLGAAATADAAHCTTSVPPRAVRRYCDGTSRDELEEHDAEAVHVGPRRQGGALGGAGAGAAAEAASGDRNANMACGACDVLTSGKKP